MAQQMTQQELYGFLEDRFECARACAECARVCALRVSTPDPDAGAEREQVRRAGIVCSEVCEATCRTLTEGDEQDADVLRIQLEWCRVICLNCAQAFGSRPETEKSAASCRACAAACTDFIAALA
ncbi:ferredoxin [Streptomyces sp. NPDC091215]|uniref:ferredoxin n=1 Tax=Streptomyces sp. NPDC091215 TaxID=3155192 RepID=UPI00342B20FC